MEHIYPYTSCNLSYPYPTSLHTLWSWSLKETYTSIKRNEIIEMDMYKCKQFGNKSVSPFLPLKEEKYNLLQIIGLMLTCRWNLEMD